MHQFHFSLPVHLSSKNQEITWIEKQKEISHKIIQFDWNNIERVFLINEKINFIQRGKSSKNGKIKKKYLNILTFFNIQLNCSIKKKKKKKKTIKTINAYFSNENEKLEGREDDKEEGGKRVVGTASVQRWSRLCLFIQRTATCWLVVYSG